MYQKNSVAKLLFNKINANLVHFIFECKQYVNTLCTTEMDEMDYLQLNV